MHTYETFCRDLEYLREHSTLVSKAAFAGMQQALGISFDLNALPYSDMRGCARIPESRFCDWMHNLCAAGGVFQYQVNQFCLAVQASGVGVDQLDEFQQSVHVPHSASPLRKSFFRDRVVAAADAHIKAFAGEILSVVPILQLFAKLVLVPLGMLASHISLLRIAATILDILRMGDGAALHAHLLRDLSKQFHTEYMDVMPQCCKPKLHYMQRTPAQLERHSKNISCFAPERKHKANKQALHYIFAIWKLRWLCVTLMRC